MRQRSRARRSRDQGFPSSVSQSEYGFTGPLRALRQRGALATDDNAADVRAEPRGPGVIQTTGPKRTGGPGSRRSRVRPPRASCAAPRAGPSRRRCPRGSWPACRRPRSPRPCSR
ncbi:hypothetical protein FGD71_040820 [Streptomyces sporangiiformans]|uniref:Uncharacterized protein n=1 Tax=Streptomyces sporangiiformans TaxID=2315329 RepID=A0A505DFF8_9ACTN|nr:hypothetical protein FGD71_040820 [Streptomyces sporangiiformans]